MGNRRADHRVATEMAMASRQSRSKAKRPAQGKASQGPTANQQQVKTQIREKHTEEQRPLSSKERAHIRGKRDVNKDAISIDGILRLC